MAALNDPEAQRNEAILHAVINEICASKNIFQGDGPPMALINTPPDSAGAVKTYIYVTFGTDGEQDQGSYMRAADTFAEALRNSTGAFDVWLQRGRTLVWRTRPEVDKSPEGKWRVYWRCVQLDDGARSIAIDWHF